MNQSKPETTIDELSAESKALSSARISVFVGSAASGSQTVAPPVCELSSCSKLGSSFVAVNGAVQTADTEAGLNRPSIEATKHAPVKGVLHTLSAEQSDRRARALETARFRELEILSSADDEFQKRAERNLTLGLSSNSGSHCAHLENSGEYPGSGDSDVLGEITASAATVAVADCASSDSDAEAPPKSTTAKIGDEALVDESQLAELLGVGPGTLRNWRCQGRGPPSIALSSRAIRYRMADVNAWLTERALLSEAKRKRRDK